MKPNTPINTTGTDFRRFQSIFVGILTQMLIGELYGPERNILADSCGWTVTSSTPQGSCAEAHARLNLGQLPAVGLIAVFLQDRFCQCPKSSSELTVFGACQARLRWTTPRCTLPGGRSEPI